MEETAGGNYYLVEEVDKKLAERDKEIARKGRLIGDLIDRQIEQDNEITQLKEELAIERKERKREQNELLIFGSHIKEA
jgi:hypothetical protein